MDLLQLATLVSYQVVWLAFPRTKSHLFTRSFSPSVAHLATPIDDALANRLHLLTFSPFPPTVTPSTTSAHVLRDLPFGSYEIVLVWGSGFFIRFDLTFR